MRQRPTDMRHHGRYANHQEGTGYDGNQLVPGEVEPIHIRLGRVSQNSARILVKTVLLLAVLLGIAVGVGYGYISQGPVSMRFAVEPMQNAIQKELDNVLVRIDDAVIQKAERGFGIVFRLKGIRFKNNDGATIAQAPSASIGLSTWGLLSGRITPASVNLIGPEVLLTKSEDGSVGFAFSQDNSTIEKSNTLGSDELNNNTGQAGQSISSQIGDTLAAAQERQIDLIQTLANLFKNAREGKDASSYLTSFGVRNATILINTETEQTEFKVPAIEMHLEHSDQSSALLGNAKLGSEDGPWNLSFRTELTPGLDQLTLLIQTNQLSPSIIANKFPLVESLKGVDVPINGLSRLDFSRSGELLKASTNLTLGEGSLNLGTDERQAIKISTGNIKIRYSKTTDVIEVLESNIHWGGSYAVFSGGFQPGQDQNGLKYWQFLLQTSDAAIQTEEFGIPKTKIDSWLAKGYVIPSQKRVNLEQLLIQAGPSFLDFSGDVVDAKGSPEIHLDGKISPMDITLFKQLWPRLAAPGAREWIGERVTQGYITGGTVKISLAGGVLDQLEKGLVDIDERSFSMKLGVQNLETYYVKDLPPLRTEEAIASFKGRRFSMSVPKGRIDLPTGQSVSLEDGKFYIKDLRDKVQSGVIEFKTKGEASLLLEFLDLPPLGYLSEANMDTNSIAGKTDGSLKLTLPLVRDVKFADMTMKGKVVLSQASFPGLVKGMDVKNGNITFNVTQQAVNAKGRVFINRVPADISWHRIFKGSSAKQPGVRVSAMLNSKRLEQLGIPAGHFVKGDFTTDITIRDSEKGKQKLQLSANMTDVELIFGSLGWSKAPGKRAVLEFDIEQLENNRTELKNFKIVGDDITINGAMSLGPDGKLKRFNFPVFSVNVVTRLAFEGIRDERDTWKINVRGAAYDGRQFFSSMFSSGQVTSGQKTARDTADVELSVKIDTVLGHSNSKMNNVSVYMQQREGRLSVLDAKGDIKNGRLIAKLKYAANENRIIRAETGNAGYAFRLIGFYPNIEGGEAALQVNLDAQNGKKQSGVLWAQNFSILGDEIVQDVLANYSEENRGIVGVDRQRRRANTVTRERLKFDQLKVPFTIGGGLFELHDSYMNGPALGVSLTGQVDFAKRKLNLGGTYIPAYALNTLFKGVPILGDILFNDGLVGITFGVEGDMDSPQVLVNPASVVAPGILKGLFKFQSPQSGKAQEFSEEVFNQ